MEEPVATLAALFREVHNRFRQIVADLDPDTLTAVLAPETNSVGTLVRHILRSEGSMLARLADRHFDRDYTEDFLNPSTGAEALLAQLDEADRRLEEWGPLITAAALKAVWPRPTGQSPTGEEWLVHHYGHLREHVAHAELTLQLLGGLR